MYDALTREYSHGNQQVDLDEIRSWSMRNLEVINKALFNLSKGHSDGSPDKKAREDATNAMFYLKERITEIEKAALTAAGSAGNLMPVPIEVTKFG